MMWGYLFVGGLVVVLWVVLTSSIRHRSQDSSLVRDSRQMKKSLGVWTRLVLERRQTPRSLKRYENRMRFLVSGGGVQDAEMMFVVGLGALVEVEELSVTGGDGRVTSLHSELNKLKRRTSGVEEIKRDLGPWGICCFESWLSELNETHWRRYVSLHFGEEA